MRRYPVLALLMLILSVVSASPGLAQFPRLPDLGDIGGDVLRGRIPGLDKILQEEPAISTSFDDAIYGVSVLDGFDPSVTAPMSQLPFTGDGGFIVALPGSYELAAKSYCLKAGTYGPGGGDGYLWAPLKGAEAGVIQQILDASMTHPEIDQHQIQSLIWGIQSRAKISDMAAPLRETAQALLTPQQIRRLNGGALGMIPDELFDQAFVDIPPEVRMVLEAEARLRDRLRQEIYDFDALEEIAVLTGDPPAETGGAEVPEGRWSWEPDGYYVRFDPNGYSETTLQLYSPEAFSAETDQTGRITALTDRAGQRLELAYAEGAPIIAEGDAAVAAHSLGSLRLLRPDRPTLELVCDAPDLVLTGVPTGDGSFDGEADALYDASQTAVSDLRTLVRNVEGASPDSPLFANVVNLAHLACALQRLAEREGAGNAGPAAMEDIAFRAVASELALLLMGEEGDTAFAAAERETRLAVLPWSAGTGLNLSQGAWGRRRELPIFQPSRGAGTPANRGRQRLGMSGASYRPPWSRPPDDDEEDDRQPSGSDSKPAYDSAKKGMDAIQNGQDAMEFVGGPAGWAAGKVGMGIPNYLFGKILDFNFDAWGRATEALGGDPPVPDYDSIAMPEVISLPAFAPDEEISPEHTAAIQALTDSVSKNLAVVRAANVTEDRLGGAMAAGDDAWAAQQAAVLVDYKRQAGLGMMEMAERIDDVLQALRHAGVEQLLITPEAVAAYQQRLRAEGFDAQELQAAQILGISEEELDAMLEERVSADPDDLSGDLMAQRAEFADALRWLGMCWSNLPAAEPGG